MPSPRDPFFAYKNSRFVGENVSKNWESKWLHFRTRIQFLKIPLWGFKNLGHFRPIFLKISVRLREMKFFALSTWNFWASFSSLVSKSSQNLLARTLKFYSALKLKIFRLRVKSPIPLINNDKNEHFRLTNWGYRMKKFYEMWWFWKNQSCRGVLFWSIGVFVLQTWWVWQPAQANIFGDFRPGF